MKIKAEKPAETWQFSFRLAPSKIGGVGVFAVHDIPAEAKLIFFDRKVKAVFVPKKKVKNPLEKRMRQWFCVETDKGYFCPPDFRRMEIGYYLNHSDRPNAACVREDIYRTARRIKAGEEITIDYRQLDGAKQEIIRKF